MLGHKTYAEIEFDGACSTVVEHGTSIRVDAASNPAQTEVASAVMRS